MRLIFLLITAIFCFSCNTKKPANTELIKESDTAGFTAIDPDSVQFSFVFMGCNRVDHKDEKDKNPNTNASTANVPELQRTFNEIAALNPKPAFYFFLGDEVLGLNSKTSKLQDQLKAWRKQYEDTSFSALPAAGIPLVAIPGNHEMLYENNGNEVPNQGATEVWMKEMGRYMPSGVTINRVGGNDSLNNQMTYSFTFGNTHFILLNTDTYNTGDTIGMAPAAWINADITAAKQDKTVQHIFLLGHKPALVNNPLYTPDGDNIMEVSVVQAIWPVMEANQVEAMLSAHSHQYDRLQPNANKTYQVIAGNGGSPYEHKAAKDTARQFFGYTIVYVMKNQQVIVQSMGRSVPASNYLESIPDTLPTTIRDQTMISWGTNAGTWDPDTEMKKLKKSKKQ